jgi:hypothetical protein
MRTGKYPDTMTEEENNQENGNFGFQGGRNDGVAGSSPRVSQTDAAGPCPSGISGPGAQPRESGRAGPVTEEKPLKRRTRRVQRKTELHGLTLEPAWREALRKKSAGSTEGLSTAKKETGKPCTLNTKNPACREVLAMLSDLQFQVENLDAEIADIREELGSHDA